MAKTLTVEQIANVIDETVERRVKDLRDRLLIAEMNLAELQQKAMLKKPIVRMPANTRRIA